MNRSSQALHCQMHYRSALGSELLDSKGTMRIPEWMVSVRPWAIAESWLLYLLQACRMELPHYGPDT